MLGVTAVILAGLSLAAVPAVAPVYIVCLIVGGGLLLISTIFGGHHHADVDVGLDVQTDVDVGMDVHTDVDVGVDAGAADGVGADGHAFDGHAEGHGLALTDWFSISFVVYFVAVFGLIGTVLSYTSSLRSLVVLGVSVAGGAVAGQGAHQLLRYLRRTSGDSKVSGADYLEMPARVTIAVPAGGRGEVAAQVRGRERFVPALAKHPDVEFYVGDRVVIVGYVNGTAEIISRDEHDFLRES
jgi:hypothetical protein